jgi:ADP-ribosylglycohydrolase
MKILALTLLVLAPLHAGERQQAISRAALLDKIRGGWAGQMIGVSYGAPTEFNSNGHINDGVFKAWEPGRVSNSLVQDDLYVEMTFAKVLDRNFGATTKDFGEAFKTTLYPLWHANLAARRNLILGVPPEQAGAPKYNAHANDIDFQIESDFIGLMAPGLPQSANEIAQRVGRLMNYGDGMYGGMFVAGMYAAAFFEATPREVVKAGLASIPRESAYAQVIADVLKWSQKEKDWRKVWQQIEDQWDTNDPCPEGARTPFNIDAKLNGAYVALGLLYGERDFGKTIEIATRAGQDSDCNPATAGGILGVMLGYSGIPVIWTSGIPAIADRTFQYTDFTFNTIVDSTLERALHLIKVTGGQVEGERIVVNPQAPAPPPLKVWDYGTVIARSTAPLGWEFSAGEWAFDKTHGAYMASQAKAEARTSFTGTGAIVVGPFMPGGGAAKVYLDGKLERSVDVNSYETGRNAGKQHEAVWHRFGLRNVKHDVRIVVRRGPLGIEGLVVYR